MARMTASLHGPCQLHVLGRRAVVAAFRKDEPRIEDRIEVGSWEEARAIQSIRLGWKPYTPVGEASPCPNCGALLYAEGSGKCWNCDRQA